ncbi:DDE_3 domain-containing protein [Trichonephila clavipes]|nr:DDE_3 domain-containing protein [Trichonephila clavipes]
MIFLRGRTIGRLECGRTQPEVSEELESPRVPSEGFGNDSKMMVIPGLVCSLILAELLYEERQVPVTTKRQVPITTTEGNRYGDVGWLNWGGIILGSRTDLHVQSVTMTDHIYRDVILEQHVRLFRGVMGAEFLFMDDNARPHRANIVDECL